MGRRVDIEHLVSSHEIAARLGIPNSQHVHYWRKKDPDFPPAVAELGGPIVKTYVWYWPDVERWARKTGRLPRRHPESAEAQGERSE